MSHIYWELNEIPIPHFALINRHDVRVYALRTGLNGERLRTVIGRAAGATTRMHPNSTFKFEYPQLWEQYHGGLGLSECLAQVGIPPVPLEYINRFSEGRKRPFLRFLNILGVWGQSPGEWERETQPEVLVLIPTPTILFNHQSA